MRLSAPYETDLSLEVQRRDTFELLDECLTCHRLLWYILSYNPVSLCFVRDPSVVPINIYLHVRRLHRGTVGCGAVDGDASCHMFEDVVADDCEDPLDFTLLRHIDRLHHAAIATLFFFVSLAARNPPSNLLCDSPN